MCSRTRNFRGVLLAFVFSTGPFPVVSGDVTGSVALTTDQVAAAKKRDHSGVVVWVDPVGTLAARATTPQSKQVSLEQRNKTFRPHVLAIEVGTAVDFPNNDPVFHNAFSNYDGQVFDVQLYAPQTSRRVVFRRPGVVRVFCNIHESMSALIAVLQTPYFAVTGPDGRFDIPAPAGDYRLRFWHERAQPDVLAKLERRITLGEASMTLPEVSIAVSTEAVPPHKDKYGHDYGQRGEDYIFYPGARR